MVAEEIGAKMAQQLEIVVDTARERFTDQVEEYIRANKVGVGWIGEADKRNIERLFSEAVYSYIVAEAVAMVSYLIYAELQNDAVVDRSVPAFLDQCEARLERIPDSMVTKTTDLTSRAQIVLESKTESKVLVDSLLRDLAGMSKIKHLRASFEAAVLNFMGE